MASHIIQNQFDFFVQDQSGYYLSVVIGNGQLGSSNFQNFNGQLFSPQVFNSPIGLGSLIRNKSTLVISLIMDVNPDTNNMVVSYFISDHILANPIPDQQLAAKVLTHVAGEGETVSFFTTIQFK